MKTLFKIISALFFLVICTQAIAQKTYVTKQGFMVIKAYSGDSSKSYQFNNIVVLLDYDNATVEMGFMLDDNLNGIISSKHFSSEHDVKITTRLAIPKIETQTHSNWEFHTEGELLYEEKTYNMTGKGELRHHNGSEVLSCYLMLRLEIGEGNELVFGSIGKVKELHLFQTVLNQRSLEELRGDGY